MSALIDDISRVIASPISRRRAFKMVSGAVGGAVLASLGWGRAAHAMGMDGPANPPCDKHGVLCGGKCYPPGYSCCGRVVCDGFHHCCADHCCGVRQYCCGSRCCDYGSTCCGNNTCCPFGVDCCHGKCCSTPGSKCCGNTCCPPGNFCCDGTCVKQRPSPSSVCKCV